MIKNGNNIFDIKGIIYLFINTINNKVLIGQTIHSFNIRYSKNKNIWINKASNDHFRRAMIKYGVDNFKVEILEYNVCEKILLNFLEGYYISKFKSFNPEFGYNKTLGGDSNVKYTDEIKEKMRLANREEPEKFIEYCKKQHNNKYDYSNVVYVNARSNILIICPVHGEFSQSAFHHKHGSQCPKCINHSSAVKLTADRILDKIKNLYKNKFSFFSYNEENEILKLKCSSHGNFEIKQRYFFRNQNKCPICMAKRRKTLRANPIACYENLNDRIPLMSFFNIQDVKNYIHNNEKIYGVTVRKVIESCRPYRNLFWKKLNSPQDFIKNKLNEEMNMGVGNFLYLKDKYSGLISKYNIDFWGIVNQQMKDQVIEFENKISSGYFV